MHHAHSHVETASSLVPVLAGGGIGIIGTLLGTLITNELVKRREAATTLGRQRRAVNAVVGELLDAASIVTMAVERQAWWPLADSPRDLAWQRYNDDLAEFLDDDTWHELRMTYETVRSFGALRELSSRRLRLWEPPSRRLTWAGQYDAASAAAEDALQALWQALGVLRERYPQIARTGDRARLEATESSPDEQSPPVAADH